MGLAVVASRIGGFIELVEPDQNGYLLDGYDDAMGVEELRMLISSPERLGEFRRTSRQLASRFDVEHIVDSYEGELQSVIDSLKASETEN